jgi:hypothetical protein
MSRLSVLVLAACAIGGLFIPCAAASEAEDKVQKARSAFDMLYGEDLKRVTATRDPADDVALAARLLDAAKAAEAQPELMAVLCAKACDLGSADPKGYDTALEAADLVSDKAPDLAAPCQDKIMDIRQRQYDVARGDEKVKAAEVLVDALLSSAAAASAAGDVTRPPSACTRPSRWPAPSSPRRRTPSASRSGPWPRGRRRWPRPRRSRPR